MGENTGTKEKQAVLTDIRQAKICEYLQGVPKALAREISDNVGMTQHQVLYYLRALIENGYVFREGDRYNATYTLTAIPYESENYRMAKLNAAPHIRVFRLLDRPQAPRAKEEKRSRHMYGGIQSGMQRFNNW